LGSTAFCAIGAFWLSWALFNAFYVANVPAAFIGWYLFLFLWGVFTTVMWVGTFRSNRSLQFTFLGAIFTFFLLAAGQWTAIALLRQLGGYAGMITGALAFYLASAQLIDETFSSNVLPLGLYQKPAEPGGKLAVTAHLVAQSAVGVRS